MPLRTRNQWWGVVLDAPDARELARFYARLLGWQIFLDPDGDGASVAPSETAGYNLGFQTEPDYARPVWPAEAGRPHKPAVPPTDDSDAPMDDHSAEAAP